ncbi:MAG: hypothetical protein LZF62_380018 [Nitrospira sp.]|nr:MAG: hypothetical protein LZF62_380018 [Nitrospira sp.]
MRQSRPSASHDLGHWENPLLLQTRIRRKEDTLYKEFDKLRASARATVTEQTTDSRASTKGFVTFNSSRSSHLAPHL